MQGQPGKRIARIGRHHGNNRLAGHAGAPTFEQRIYGELALTQGLRMFDSPDERIEGRIELGGGTCRAAGLHAGHAGRWHKECQSATALAQVPRSAVNPLLYKWLAWESQFLVTTSVVAR